MSNLINKKVFPVTSADTDMFGRLRISSLVNMFIQSAITSADQLGFGYRDLQKANLFWVLSRLTVEISNTLHWTDEAETETWPKNIDRFIYIRDFIVRNASKTAGATATSGWLVVNQESIRPAKIELFIFAGFLDAIYLTISSITICEKSCCTSLKIALSILSYKQFSGKETDGYTRSNIYKA